MNASDPSTGESWGTSISSNITALPRGMAEGLLVGRGISTVEGTDIAAWLSLWGDAACWLWVGSLVIACWEGGDGFGFDFGTESLATIFSFGWTLGGGGGGALGWVSFGSFFFDFRITAAEEDEEGMKGKFLGRVIMPN